MRLVEARRLVERLAEKLSHHPVASAVGHRWFGKLRGLCQELLDGGVLPVDGQAIVLHPELRALLAIDLQGTAERALERLVGLVWLDANGDLPRDEDLTGARAWLLDVWTALDRATGAERSTSSKPAGTDAPRAAADGEPRDDAPEEKNSPTWDGAPPSSWEDVKIEFVAEHSVRIKVDGDKRARPKTAEAMGMASDGGAVNTRWLLLKRFAQLAPGERLTPTDCYEKPDGSNGSVDSDAVSYLRKALRAYFPTVPNTEDPLKHESREVLPCLPGERTPEEKPAGWAPRIKLKDCRSGEDRPPDPYHDRSV